MSIMIRPPARMRIQRQTFRCMQCRVRFEHEMAINVAIEVYMAQVKAMYCPGCLAGPEKIGMGEGRTLEEDLPDRLPNEPLAVRAANWLRFGERGQSADQIHSLFFSGDVLDRTPPYPHDMDDFRRCFLLLGHVPEREADISKMAAVSVTWSALAAAWAEISRLYREEAPNCEGPAPRAAEALARALKVEVAL